MGRQKYIHNFARTLMGNLGIQGALSYSDCETREDLAKALIKDHWMNIIDHLSRGQTDETCGRLAACGLGEDAHHKAESRQEGAFTILDIVGTEHPWLDAGYSGRLILSRTATAAVLAAMADNIWSDLKRQREEAEAIGEEIDRELKPFTFRTADKLRIKQLADKRGTTVSVVVREAIDRFLQEEWERQSA